MVYLPHIDPKRANYGKFAGAYRLIRVILIKEFMSATDANLKLTGI
jgi:hypothetical protein